MKLLQLSIIFLIGCDTISSSWIDCDQVSQRDKNYCNCMNNCYVEFDNCFLDNEKQRDYEFLNQFCNKEYDNCGENCWAMYVNENFSY